MSCASDAVERRQSIAWSLMIKARGEHGYSAILCCCQRNRSARTRQMTADSAPPTSISTITAALMPEASVRASDSMISRPITRSAPMNSPRITSIQRKAVTGDSEANTHAMVEGITTVNLPFADARLPCTALVTPSSIERRATTTIKDVTIFDLSPIPNDTTMIGASAMRWMEFTAVMKGWNISLSRPHRPAADPLRGPATRR
jgi:hypothetical protein